MTIIKTNVTQVDNVEFLDLSLELERVIHVLVSLFS